MEVPRHVLKRRVDAFRSCRGRLEVFQPVLLCEELPFLQTHGVASGVRSSLPNIRQWQQEGKRRTGVIDNASSRVGRHYYQCLCPFVCGVEGSVPPLSKGKLKVLPRRV